MLCGNMSALQRTCASSCNNCSAVQVPQSVEDLSAARTNEIALTMLGANDSFRSAAAQLSVNLPNAGSEDSYLSPHSGLAPRVAEVASSVISSERAARIVPLASRLNLTYFVDLLLTCGLVMRKPRG